MHRTNSIGRMAERVLPRLASGAVLCEMPRIKRRGAPGLRRMAEWRLRDASGCDAGVVEGSFVADWLGRGWLERVQGKVGCLVIADGGRDWLRRESVEPGGLAPKAGEPSRGQAHWRQGEVEHMGVGRVVTVNVSENPLAWLARRKDADGHRLISPVQLAAGERFRRDHEIAAATPSVTMNLDHGTRGSARGARGDGPVALLDGVIAARKRMIAALDAVGPDLAPVLTEICCLSSGLEATERLFRWPPRTGKIVLQIALSTLARHYGMETGPVDGADRRAIRHQAVADYRPSL